MGGTAQPPKEAALTRSGCSSVNRMVNEPPAAYPHKKIFDREALSIEPSPGILGHSNQLQVDSLHARFAPFESIAVKRVHVVFPRCVRPGKYRHGVRQAELLEARMRGGTYNRLVRHLKVERLIIAARAAVVRLNNQEGRASWAGITSRSGQWNPRAGLAGISRTSTAARLTEERSRTSRRSTLVLTRRRGVAFKSAERFQASPWGCYG